MVVLPFLADDVDGGGAVRIGALEVLPLVALVEVEGDVLDEVLVAEIGLDPVAQLLDGTGGHHDDLQVLLGLHLFAQLGQHAEQHVVGAQDEHVVLEAVAALAFLVGLAHVLEDVAHHGDEHRGEEEGAEQRDDEPEDVMLVHRALEHARIQIQSDDVLPTERAVAEDERRDAEKDEERQQQDDRQPKQLPSLPFGKKPVKPSA